MATKPRIARSNSEHIVSKSKSKKKRKNRKPKLMRSHTNPSKALPIAIETRSGVPRKLGPRDIGRIKYKGTKYTDSEEMNNSSFLDEKIYTKCKSKSFQQRKSKN